MDQELRSQTRGAEAGRQALQLAAQQQQTEARQEIFASFVGGAAGRDRQGDGVKSARRPSASNGYYGNILAAPNRAACPSPIRMGRRAIWASLTERSPDPYFCTPGITPTRTS